MKKEHLAAGYSVSQTTSQLYWCARKRDFSYPRAERRGQERAELSVCLF